MTDDAPTPPPAAGRPGLGGHLLVLALLACLYVPLAGSYTLFDPWETHYAEVARTMNATGNYLSPRWQEENFWSKPAGQLWLLAFSMRLFGVGQGAPDEMVTSNVPEWSLRLPIIVISIFGIWAMWLLVTRLVSRRAGWLTAAILATMPQWAFITRQAMTDMPDVGLMTGGLALLFLALKDEEAEKPLRAVAVGPVRLTAFHIVLLVVAALVLLQTIHFALGMAKGFLNRRAVPPMVAVGHMSGYGLCLLAFGVIGWLTVRTRRQLLLVIAYLTFALAVLMKGILGVAIPGMVVLAYLIVTWDFTLLRRAELHLGVLVVIAVAFPWYHAMIALHGMPFYKEMFIQHHFQRLAAGVHGDKGSFEYFITQLGPATFPWAALGPVALAHVLASRPGRSTRDRTVCFGAVWFVATFALFSLSMTKFHHYILPALPGLAVVVAVYLDDLADERITAPLLGVLISGGFLVLTAAMIAQKPIRLIWLYIYNYTRPFPDLRFGPTVWLLAAVCAVPLLVLLVRPARRIGVWLAVAAAAAFTLWAIDGYMIQVAPHWGQKILIRQYYQLRAGPDERLIAWQMNWRGENFYTKGAIAGPRPERWTVFMSLDNNQMLSYVKARPGRKFFFLLEHTRLATFKRILPTETAKQTLRIEDSRSNNKFLLASATM
ncbi:MAG: glycosyltransferase family 39 protein [Deltaproteobacteria bacterium]|nr:glycosyltransferase family 39 protein [Deltaproteobacteria bacterium]